jgi:tetratricopeptide (TPR) repeat protein
MMPSPVDPQPAWERVKAIVADAVGRPPGERAAFVAAACAGSDALRREVESLVAAHDAASGFIERPANVPVAAIEALGEPGLESISPGSTIGPYRIGRVLGSGGMGAVYLAERADETFRRQVAIKVVAGALARPDLVPRFLTERRILAALDHPHIARLLDAGATDTGAPYVVMELVDGQPIDQYCRAKPLATRLEAVQKVCAAVHYAHQHLVVHRDIKASNILVTQDGQPKLLDFGIAKLLEPELASRDRTDTTARALTPESASPEQLRNEPVTMASDVYSLGVLLYRLITGRKPFDPASSSASELVRAICEVDPPPPSQASAPDAPKLDPEIDWITMMALRKEPSRRYGSAQQLAEDLGRYLEGRPVLAAPDRWSYRASKFVRRRWGTVAATAAVILALGAGAAMTYVQARRAERRFDDVRKLAGSVVGEIYDRIADLPGSTDARKLLVSRSLEYLDSLAAEAAGDVALQRELGGAYEKIGDVQGNPYGANLGDVAGAQATFDKLLRIRQAVFDGRGRTWDDVNELADAHAKLGDLAYGQGKYQQSADTYTRAIELLEAHQPPPASAAAGGRVLARWYGRRGVALTAAGKPPEAIASLTKAINLMRPLAEAPGAEPILGTELAIHSVNVGDVYNYQRNFAKALEYHQLGVAAMRQGLAVDSKSVSPRRRLALTLARVAADLIELKRYEEAIGPTKETIALFEGLAAGDPSSVQFQFDLADVIGNLALIQEKAGQLDDALATIRRSLAISDAADTRNPNFADHRFNYAEAVGTHALIQARRGGVADAVREYRRQLALYEQPGVADRNPSVVPMAREGLGDALVALARKAGTDDRWREARQEYERARDGWHAIKAKGALGDQDAGRPDAIEKKIAECTAALARG